MAHASARGRTRAGGGARRAARAAVPGGEVRGRPRRHAVGPHLRGGDQDDLAQQSADDALVSILGKLDEFRGDSRFTTWAYKFALYEAAAHVRRRSWQGREIPLTDEAWPLFADERRRLPDERAQSSELFAALGRRDQTELTSHQREVLLASPSTTSRSTCSPTA